jgi:HSP20 family protein
MVDLKALVPWRGRSETPASGNDFFAPLAAFRHEVDRLFDSFVEGFGNRDLTNGGDWRSPMPALDIAETDKELVITAEVPGISEKDVDVTVSGDVLTIKGEKKAEQEDKNDGYSYVERRYGCFSRALRLPFEVKDENVEAKYDKGVLTIRIPKPAGVQKPVRQIEVKAA